MIALLLLVCVVVYMDICHDAAGSSLEPTISCTRRSLPSSYTNYSHET